MLNKDKFEYLTHSGVCCWPVSRDLLAEDLSLTALFSSSLTGGLLASLSDAGYLARIHHISPDRLRDRRTRGRL